jgi:hypothetical protein
LYKYKTCKMCFKYKVLEYGEFSRSNYSNIYFNYHFKRGISIFFFLVRNNMSKLRKLTDFL